MDVYIYYRPMFTFTIDHGFHRCLQLLSARGAATERRQELVVALLWLTLVYPAITYSYRSAENIQI